MSNSQSEYYNELSSLVNFSKTGDDTVFYNNDVAHNASVMSVFFDHSKSIKMYCGKMSIFRKEFQQEIRKQKPNESSDVIARFKNNLMKFIEKDNSSIEIIVESSDDTFWNDVDMSLFDKRKITVYKLTEEPKLRHIIKDWGHFTVADKKMYRKEINKDKRTAMGKMNNEDGARVLLDKFYFLKHLSVNLSPQCKKVP